MVLSIFSYQGEDKSFYFHHFYSIVLDILAREIRQEKEIRDIQIVKVKLSLFIDDMIIYIEKPRLCQKTIRIDKSTQSSSRIQHQTSVAFLYTTK
jgi:hypothetical protein